MTNRTDVQDDCIDAYAAKTGATDNSVTPNVVSELLQVMLDNSAMSDEVASLNDILLIANTFVAMGNTVSVDGLITKALTGTGDITLTPPVSPQPVSGGDYAGYVKLDELNLIEQKGLLTVVNGQIEVGLSGDYKSNQAWLDVSGTGNSNNLGFIFGIERSGVLIFSNRPTGSRQSNGQDRTNISGGGFLNGLVAGDKLSVWVASEKSITLTIYDANLGIDLRAPASLVT